MTHNEETSTDENFYDSSFVKEDCVPADVIPERSTLSGGVLADLIDSGNYYCLFVLSPWIFSIYKSVINFCSGKAVMRGILRQSSNCVGAFSDVCHRSVTALPDTEQMGTEARYTNDLFFKVF